MLKTLLKPLDLSENIDFNNIILIIEHCFKIKLNIYNADEGAWINNNTTNWNNFENDSKINLIINLGQKKILNSQKI